MIVQRITDSKVMNNEITIKLRVVKLAKWRFECWSNDQAINSKTSRIWNLQSSVDQLNNETNEVKSSI